MNHYADALIVTRGELNDAELDQVASHAQSIGSIRQLTRSKRIPRLIWVSYNTGKIRARTILNQFKEFGYHASLVDM